MTHRVGEVPGRRCCENWEEKVDSSNWSDGAGFLLWAILAGEGQEQAFLEGGMAGDRAQVQEGTALKKQKRSPFG